MRLPRRATTLLASAVLCALFFTACGGDDGDERAPTGTDQEFVQSLCSALSAFDLGFREASQAAAAEKDADRAVERLSVPISEFADAFAKLPAPADLVTWRDDGAVGIARSADRFREEKDFDALSDLGASPVPDPPAAARTRLDAVVAQTPACAGRNVFKPRQ